MQNLTYLCCHERSYMILFTVQTSQLDWRMIPVSCWRLEVGGSSPGDLTLTSALFVNVFSSLLTHYELSRNAAKPSFLLSTLLDAFGQDFVSSPF